MFPYSFVPLLFVDLHFYFSHILSDGLLLPEHFFGVLAQVRLCGGCTLPPLLFALIFGRLFLGCGFGCPHANLGFEAEV